MAISPSEATSEPASERPVVLFDEECAFCKRWIGRWQELTGDAVVYRPYQGALDDYPELDEDDLARAMHLVEPDGEVVRGAHAVYRALSRASMWRYAFFLSLYERVPPFAWAADVGYRTVAAHRPLAATLTRWLWGTTKPQGFRHARWIFLRLLGLSALAAFLSLWVQVHGLIGSEGILPVVDYMARVRQVLAPAAGAVPLSEALQVPTLFWFSASDAALSAVCGAGAGLSVLLLLGVAPRFVLPPLWLLYLSLSSVGQVFLGYQWDALLLETLLVACFLAPGGLFPRPSREPAVPWWALWVAWFLLFKLIFLSGVVKLLSRDPSWASLTAMDYHYLTQPLPAWTAYYVAKLPGAFHVATTAVVLAVELAAPFLILGPRRLRHTAAFLFAGLMLGIMATGTYGFFNVLTVALCALLVDDGAWRRRLPARWGGDGETEGGGEVKAAVPDRRRPAWRLGLEITGLAVMLGLSGFALKQRLAYTEPSEPLATVQRWIGPLRSFNGYGLFAVMTTERREIVIEGSRDGITWEPYRLPWKPDAPGDTPHFATPHMPRLDWQLWFAALGECRQNPWLSATLQRLLEGSPAVRGLFDDPPFADEPPRWLRTPMYRYRFAKGDGWFTEDPLGGYCPPVRLDGGRIQRSQPPLTPR